MSLPLRFLGLQLVVSFNFLCRLYVSLLSCFGNLWLIENLCPQLGLCFLQGTRCYWDITKVIIIIVIVIIVVMVAVIVIVREIRDLNQWRRRLWQWKSHKTKGITSNTITRVIHFNTCLSRLVQNKYVKWPHLRRVSVSPIAPILVCSLVNESRVYLKNPFVPLLLLNVIFSSLFIP